MSIPVHTTSSSSGPTFVSTHTSTAATYSTILGSRTSTVSLTSLSMPAPSDIFTTTTVTTASAPRLSCQPQSQPEPQQHKKRGKTKEPVLPLTPHEAEVAFLKQELGSAQTKIVMLDSEIDDLNKTIKIQQARLRILEESQNKKSHEKYFKDYQSCYGPICSEPAPRPSCPCAQRSFNCYHSTFSTQNDAPCSYLKTLSNQVSKLSEDIELIKNLMNSQPSAQLSPNIIPVPASPTSRHSPPAHPGSPICNADISMISTTMKETPGDTSRVSLEEFIFSPNSTVADNLNCSVPTSQLTQLMQ